MDGVSPEALEHLKQLGRDLSDADNERFELAGQQILLPVDHFPDMRKNHFSDEMIGHAFNLPVEEVTALTDGYEASLADSARLATEIDAWGKEHGTNPWPILYPRATWHTF